MSPRLKNWCLKHGADETQSTSLVEAVLSKYSETHRHYHNLEHIHSSLAHLDQLDPSNAALEGAIWFHDVIYDPSSSQNESQSARFFESLTTSWLDPACIAKVVRLILTTDLRLPRSEDREEVLMVDIDLAILGSKAATYERYRQSIRREYSHVPEDDFKQARSLILRQLLARPIFHGSDLEHLEVQARSNLRHELNELTR